VFAGGHEGDSFVSPIWGFGWFFMLIFWVLVILGLVYIIRSIAGSTKEKNRRRQPLISLRRDMQEGR
jgi:uncharacterized membrane protein